MKAEPGKAVVIRPIITSSRHLPRNQGTLYFQNSRQEMCCKSVEAHESVAIAGRLTGEKFHDEGYIDGLPGEFHKVRLNKNEHLPTECFIRVVNIT